MSHVTIILFLMSHVTTALNAPCRPVDFRGLGPYYLLLLFICFIYVIFRWLDEFYIIIFSTVLMVLTDFSGRTCPFCKKET